MKKTISNLDKLPKVLIISDSFEDEKKSVSRHMTDLLYEVSSRNVLIDIISYTPILVLNDLIKKKTNKISYARKFFSNNNLFLRGLNELFFGFQIIKILSKNKTDYNMTLWYSPSIFIGFGLFFSNYKKLGKKIMILRDIFPEWAIDLNIIKKNSLSYFLLKYFSKFQYIISDIIFVQSERDKYIINKKTSSSKKIEILYSWYTINISNEFIHSLFYEFNKRPFVLCLGDIETAQNLENMLIIIKNLSIKNPNINYVFFGLRPKSLNKFLELKKDNNLKNLFVYSKIDQKYIPYLCHNAVCGIFSLNNKFKTDNVPGRFIMYACCGLKSFGFFRNNKELENIISNNNLGEYADFDDKNLILKFFDFLNSKSFKKSEILKKSSYLFSTKFAVDRIINHL